VVQFVKGKAFIVTDIKNHLCELHPCTGICEGSTVATVPALMYLLLCQFTVTRCRQLIGSEFDGVGTWKLVGVAIAWVTKQGNKQGNKRPRIHLAYLEDSCKDDH
jgi:hypothetical protein